jgi:hypothetical protein
LSHNHSATLCDLRPAQLNPVTAASPRIVSAANQQVMPTVGNYQNNVANRDYRSG